LVMSQKSTASLEPKPAEQLVETLVLV
jgi:hypothetical protein